MMWIPVTIIAALIGTTFSAELLPLVPYPKKIELKTGTFTPAAELNLVVTPDGPIKDITDVLVGDLAGIGFKVLHGKTQPDRNTQSIELILSKDLNIAEEGYELRIDGNICITASSPDGLFWGTRTLMQLLRAGPGKAIPQSTITDKPEFPYRALMIDNARHFHSIDFHVKMVKSLASFKMNRYQIHFSDHQSYTLPSTLFPSLPTAGRGCAVER